MSIKHKSISLRSTHFSLIRMSLNVYTYCLRSVDIVQWSEDLYEEQLVDRTKNACGGPVDIVIDFSATSRSIRRALKCLHPVSDTHFFALLYYLCIVPTY